MAKNPSEPKQLLLGLEAYLLGIVWFINPPTKKGERKSVYEFYRTLDELHNPQSIEELDSHSEDTFRKRYANYLDKLESKYSINIQLQQKQYTPLQNPSLILRLARFLVDQVAVSSSDESLQIVLNNWKEPISLLTFLVAIRYAIQDSFPLEFKYKKQMDFRSQSRRVFPRALTVYEGQLSLIAFDTKDKETKSFLVSRISEPKLLFWESLLQGRRLDYALPKFSLEDFLHQSPNAKFQKKEISYQIRIAKNNVDLLRHSTTLPFTILEEEEGSSDCTIEITTFNQYKVYDLLFNYYTYARLLAPPDAVKRFQNKLKTLSEFYDSKTRAKPENSLVHKKSSQKKL